MKQAHGDHTATELPRLSALFYTLGLVIIALMMFAMWEAAAAQTSPPPAAQQPGMQPKLQSTIDPRLKAPIGHRQPRLQDLPPSVRQDEGHTTIEERSLDEKLQICRPC
jgi:hypothetical protein